MPRKIRPPSPPRLVRDLDPRCMQLWLRPPQPDDLGMEAVAAAIAVAGPGTVVVLGEPEIPCAVQTTHPWSQHLGPYLRRAGLEREIGREVTADAAIVIDWTQRSDAGTPIAIPALDTTLWIRSVEEAAFGPSP